MRPAAIFGILLAAGCTTPAPAPPERAIGLPNPASAYCVEQGGRVEIRDGAGGQVGYCHLPDGRVVEEWELFRASRPGGGT
jgi:Putative hemolysin